MTDIVSAVQSSRGSRVHRGARAGALAYSRMDLRQLGITETDSREQSGIWSTASSVLAAYRSAAALDSTARTPFDADAFVAERQTLYICASGDTQAHVGPLIVGLIRDLRSAAYRQAASVGRENSALPPVLLILDELANIAPIHDLPTLIAEGGSQGLVTIACLQDLSQARARWGVSRRGVLRCSAQRSSSPASATQERWRRSRCSRATST